MLRLTTRLVKDGHEVRAVLPYDGELCRELERVGVEVEIQHGLALVDGSLFKSPGKFIGFLVRFPFSLVRMMALIKRCRPDIVHTNTSVVLTSGLAARLLRVPHVWHIRENYSEFRSFWKLYQHYMGLFSDAIICVSGSIQEQFSARIKAGKTHVINNGFPKEEFLPVGEERVELFRNSFSQEGGDPLVGLIGRINIQRKGQNVLVDAVARLGDKYPDARFLIIGSVFPGKEWHLEALEKQMVSLGVRDRFVLTGEIEDIKAAYAALDVVLMVSELPEAFNGVVIEGMAMGKPVVGTDAGGTAEQIIDGETGFLIPPGDSGALAGALDCLLCDESLRRKMGEAGRGRFMEEFEFEPYYLRMKKIYEGLSK